MSDKSFKLRIAFLATLIVTLAGVGLFLFNDDESGYRYTPPPVPPAAAPEATTASGGPAGLPGPENNFADTGAEGQLPGKPPERRQPGLSPEEKEENRQEIARMKEALPDNIWIPEAPGSGMDSRREEVLGKAIELEGKIRNGTATKEEQVDYYTAKIKSTRDRIELIRYIAGRTAELSESTGREYLTEEDTAAGEQAVAGLEKELSDYRDKLSALR